MSLKGWVWQLQMFLYGWVLEPKCSLMDECKNGKNHCASLWKHLSTPRTNMFLKDWLFIMWRGGSFLKVFSKISEPLAASPPPVFLDPPFLTLFSKKGYFNKVCPNLLTSEPKIFGTHTSLHPLTWLITGPLISWYKNCKNDTRLYRPEYTPWAIVNDQYPRRGHNMKSGAEGLDGVVI